MGLGIDPWDHRKSFFCSVQPAKCYKTRWYDSEGQHSKKPKHQKTNQSIPVGIIIGIRGGGGASSGAIPFVASEEQAVDNVRRFRRLPDETTRVGGRGRVRTAT